MPSTPALLRHTLAASVAALAALAVSAAPRAGATDLQPGPADANDTTVYQQLPTSNLDAGGSFGNLFGPLLVATRTSGTPIPGHELQGQIAFDLPSLAIPSETQVNAQLQVYALNAAVPFPITPASAASPVDVDVFAFDSDAGFDSTTATWNNSPYTRDAQLNPDNLGPALDTTTVDASEAWFSFDVSSAVENAITAGASSIGFVLVSQTSDWNGTAAAGLIAATGDHADPTLRPILSVNALTSLAGDYNNSGLVEQGDLDLVLLNWGTTGTPAGWVNQPPVGIIDQAELDGVLLNWGFGSVSEPAGETSGQTPGNAVPEPALAGLLITAAAMLRRRH